MTGAGACPFISQSHADTQTVWCSEAAVQCGEHLGKHPLRSGEGISAVSIWDAASLEVFEVRLHGALSNLI